MIEYPATDEMPQSHLPFSPVTKVGNLLFVSGQASVDQHGTIVSGTFEAEVSRSIENLAAVLEAAGSGLQWVVQTRNYVRDASNVAKFNEIYMDYFSHPYPSRTTISNCLPPTLQFEIECIAVVPNEDHQ